MDVKINRKKADAFEKIVKEFTEKLDLLNQCYPGDEDSFSLILLADTPNENGKTSSAHQAISGRGTNLFAMLMGLFGSTPKIIPIVKGALTQFPKVAKVALLLKAMTGEYPEEEMEKLKNVLRELGL